MEAFAMIGATFAFDQVDGSAGMRGLQQLLQGRLVIAERCTGSEFAGQIGCGAKDVTLGKAADGSEIVAGVEVEGGDDRFHGVGQKRGLATAAGALFPPTKA